MIGHASFQAFGTVAKTPSLDKLPNGTSRFVITLVANLPHKPKGSDKWTDRPTWLRLAVFGDKAERLARAVKKGQALFVEGNISSYEQTDSQGQKTWGVNFNVQTVRIAQDHSHPRSQPQPEKRSDGPQPSAAPYEMEEPVGDDALPFS
jgi:single-stranded DNA-binding protein